MTRKMALEEFKKKNYGKRGTKERDAPEAGCETFKIGALIHDTRLEMGMTQEQLLLAPTQKPTTDVNDKK